VLPIHFVQNASIFWSVVLSLSSSEIPVVPGMQPHTDKNSTRVVQNIPLQNWHSVLEKKVSKQVSNPSKSQFGGVFSVAGPEGVRVPLENVSGDVSEVKLSVVFIVSWVGGKG